MALNIAGAEALDTALGTLDTTITATNVWLGELSAQAGAINGNQLMFRTYTIPANVGTEATSVITVPGALTNDAVFAQCKTVGTACNQSHVDSVNITAADTVTITWDAALDPDDSIWEILVVRSPNPYLTVARMVPFASGAVVNNDAALPGLVAADVALGMVAVKGCAALGYEDCTAMGYQAANNVRLAHGSLDDSALLAHFAAAKRSWGTKIIAHSETCVAHGAAVTTTLTVPGVTTAHKIFTSIRTAAAGLTVAGMESAHASATNTVVLTHTSSDPAAGVIDIIAFDPS